MSKAKIFVDIEMSDKFGSVDITSDLNEADTLAIFIDTSIQMMKRKWKFNKKDIKECFYARLNKAFPPDKVA